MNLRSSVILLLFAMLVSCSSNYQIEGSYPTPLVSSIPIQLELEFDDIFQTYTYKEEAENRSKVSIALGPAQMALFETITQGMFTGRESSPSLHMKPAVNGFQYSIPRETRAEIYEVWLKYRILVEEPNGATLADWLITGYGKTPSAFMKSQGEAIEAATNIALRDIGSQIAIGFPHQPDIKRWLHANNVEP